MLCCMCLPLASLAQTKISPSPAFELHKEAKFEAAATRGLADLLAQPWNHELRLLVADSLQRMGKRAEAKIQLETLDGTPVAKEAKARLSALESPVSNTSTSLPTPTPTPTPAVTIAPIVIPEILTKPAVNTPVEVPVNVPAQVSVPSVSAATNTLQPALILAPLTLSQSSVVTPGGAFLQLSPFQYIPPAGARATESAALLKRIPEHQRIVDLSTAGNYQDAGTEGLALQGKGSMDDELKLIFANSLAWTGRLPEATQAYQSLTSGKLAKEAKIGLANIDRWLGYDHRAAPVYRSVLETDPSNDDALSGLELTTRELSPRTMLTYGGNIDSSALDARAITANHRWRDSTGANVMEIETSRYKGSLPGIVAEQKDATFRYRALEEQYTPSFEVSTIGNAVYGGVGASFASRQILVELGVVNWGRFTVNPNAVAETLSASHIGLQASHMFSFGRLVARADGYGVSDGNTIWTSSLRMSPNNWQPLGSHFKPLLGIETRDAKFNTLNYWSPAQGYGSVYAGLLGEWGEGDWNLYASGQLGRPLYGEAGNSWSWTTGGKWWMTRDIGISLNLWGLANQRDDAPYRANTFSLSLEKLWR